MMATLFDGARPQAEQGSMHPGSHPEEERLMAAVHMRSPGSKGRGLLPIVAIGLALVGVLALACLLGRRSTSASPAPRPPLGGLLAASASFRGRREVEVSPQPPPTSELLPAGPVGGALGADAGAPLTDVRKRVAAKLAQLDLLLQRPPPGAGQEAMGAAPQAELLDNHRRWIGVPGSQPGGPVPPKLALDGSRYNAWTRGDTRGAASPGRGGQPVVPAQELEVDQDDWDHAQPRVDSGGHSPAVLADFAPRS
mmetsp:Transcript_14842/g.42033  ORF Transcript_14842/g.42033 Transcript_14842/m.42033 type:complete len:253 (+) Transcript_14842:53-811(+)